MECISLPKRLRAKTKEKIYSQQFIFHYVCALLCMGVYCVMLCTMYDVVYSEFMRMHEDVGIYTNSRMSPRIKNPWRISKQPVIITVKSIWCVCMINKYGNLTIICLLSAPFQHSWFSATSPLVFIYKFCLS